MKEKKSFLIDIVNNQNHTWQGTVLWVQEQKEIPFRSALELLELIHSAVDDGEEEYESKQQ